MKPETDSEWVELLREAREAEVRANKRVTLAEERERDAIRAHEDAKRVAGVARGAYYDVMTKFRSWLGEA